MNNSVNKPLQGKAALVTGGSRGIGAAIARRLADDGADVAISYNASADQAEAIVEELRGKGARATAFKADQAHADQVAQLVKHVAEYFGRLDILVNNAGHSQYGTIQDLARDAAAFERLFAVNVGGVVAAVHAAATLLSDNGRIISIGSAVSSYAPFPGVADYVAGKAAIVGYTRGWARDLGSRGITVNVVQPGPIETDLNPSTGDFATAQKGLTALGRYAQPEEVAAFVGFLAGPEAGFITGAALNIDGGVNA